MNLRRHGLPKCLFNIILLHIFRSGPILVGKLDVMEINELIFGIIDPNLV